MSVTPPSSDALPDEIRRAKWPHEIFLINLVFNHILVFASTFGVYSTFPLMVLVVPVTSAVIMAYIFVRARQIAASSETPLVKAHWAIADRRNKVFFGLLTLMAAIGGGTYWIGTLAGWSKIALIAVIGGVGILPLMVSILVLVVVGNASMYQARHNQLPKEFETVRRSGPGV